MANVLGMRAGAVEVIRFLANRGPSTRAARATRYHAMTRAGASAMRIKMEAEETAEMPTAIHSQRMWALGWFRGTGSWRASKVERGLGRAALPGAILFHFKFPLDKRTALEICKGVSYQFFERRLPDV